MPTANPRPNQRAIEAMARRYRERGPVAKKVAKQQTASRKGSPQGGGSVVTDARRPRGGRLSGRFQFGTNKGNRSVLAHEPSICGYRGLPTTQRVRQRVASANAGRPDRAAGQLFQAGNVLRVQLARIARARVRLVRYLVWAVTVDRGAVSQALQGVSHCGCRLIQVVDIPSGNAQKAGDR